MTDPLKPENLLHLAHATLARLDFAGTVEILFKAEPSPERDVLLARAYRNTARPRDAEKLLKPLVDSNPNAAAELGVLTLILGSHDDARALFEKALALSDAFEFHVDAIHGLAFIEEARTKGTPDRKRVYALLQQGLEAHPAHPMLMQTLGIAHLNDGHIDEARSHFERVIAARAEPPFAGTRFQVEAHGNMACALVAAGEIDAALDEVERAMEVCPRWLRQGMAMAMGADPDLAVLHDHPEFIASMRMRHDGPSREERIAAVEAERTAEPEPLPSSTFLDAELKSGDSVRVDEACRVVKEIVDAREQIWEDHGWCEERVQKRAEQIIDRSLRDVAWLEHEATSRGSLPCIELVTLLLGSHDDSLREVGGPLAIAVLKRWLSEEGHVVMPILETLSWHGDPCFNEPIVLPECRPLLLAAALDASAATSIRREALEALAIHGTAEDARDLVRMVREPSVAARAVETVFALDSSLLDPVALLEMPTTRYQTALSYAEELGNPNLDALIAVVRERGEPWEREKLMRKLALFADDRLVPVLIDHLSHSAYWCLASLRSRKLTDAQLTTVLGFPYEEERASYWLADVVRGQARRVSFEGEVPALDGDERPTEGAAQLVGYLGLRDRLEWLRSNLAGAGKRATAGIVVALGILGDESDLSVLERLGAQVSFLRNDTLFARTLLSGDLDLLTEATPKSLFALWALERLVEVHGRDTRIDAALDRASERGLHNEDLAEFRRVLGRSHPS